MRATLVIILSFLIAPAMGEENQALVEQVRCAEIAFSVALETGDIEAFREMIQPDARFIGNAFSVRSGRDNIVEAWSGLFAEDAPDMLWRPRVTEVSDDGDVAFSRGPYRVRGTLESGERYEDWGIFNSVWTRGEDGKWRVLFDAGFPANEPFEEDVRQLIEHPAPPCRAASGKPDSLLQSN